MSVSHDPRHDHSQGVMCYGDDMDETPLDTRHTTKSEMFIGCCEMTTDAWACGNADLLIGTDVHTRGMDDEWTEYLYVCLSCRAKFMAEVAE